MKDITIVDVGYRSTRYWVISAGRSRLLLDLGWPGKFGQLRNNLRRMDIALEELRYGLATHYHIDHAGAAQDLKQAGVPLLVLEVQAGAIPQMKQWIKPQEKYTEITTDDNVVIRCDESRAFLAEIDIPGKIVHTPGHSDDSVSLLLDDGSVFTGDLTAAPLATEAQAQTVAASWRKLMQRGARTVYPGHGPVGPIERFAGRFA